MTEANPDPDTPQSERPAKPRKSLAKSLAKPVFIAVGWVMVTLGVIGIIVPGLPTTIFLIIALWAFARGSDRFHDWLLNHNVLGPPIKAWRDHGVIPTRAKIMAVSVMSLSWLIIYIWVTDDWRVLSGVGLVLIAVACFIVTRPSRPET